MSALSGKRNAVADEAVAWLQRLEKGCSDEGRAEFVRWFKHSALHREQFLITSGLREGLKRLEAQSQSANAAGEQNGFPANKVYGRHTGLRPAVLAIAGVVVLATLAFPLFDWLSTDHQPLVAPRDVSQQITLKDGSTIQLNTRARAEMVISRHSRELRLYAGEVRISVFHDPSRPFHLISGSFVVHDVGTEFLTSPQDTGIRVLVLSGTARLTYECHSEPGATATQSRAVQVDRQQELSVADNHCTTQWHPRTLEQREIDQKTAWTLGRLSFHGVRLAEVADLFNRYNALQLKVDPAIGYRRVSGHFLATDPEGFVHSVEKSLGVKIVAVPPGAPKSGELYVVDSHSNPVPMN